ncbi:MAG: hypothetical protein HQL93_03405 [Magnetococcales bacterium]|nr:hypothetical protein [Magnetococcales bacterium]
MIELVIVMVVLAIFSSAGIGAYVNYRQNAASAVLDEDTGRNNRNSSADAFLDDSNSSGWVSISGGTPSGVANSMP